MYKRIVNYKYTRLPFIPLLLCAIAGVLTGEYLFNFETSGMLATGFLVITIYFHFTKIKYVRSLPLFLTILLFFAFYHSYRQTSDINQQNIFNDSEKIPIIARGFLLDVPLPLNYSNNADGTAFYSSSDEYFEFEYSLSDLYSFRFHVIEYFDGKNSIEIDETIQVFGKNGYPNLPLNKKIEMPIRVYTLSKPQNPGEFDYRKYQRELGIMRYADYESSHGFKEVKPSFLEKISLKRFAINVRASITKIALKLPPKHSALFLTLTTGNSTLLSRESRDVFRLTGTLHLLVISGLHIGFLVLIMELLLKVFRFNLRTKAVIMLVLLIFYWLVVGYKISITRAIVIGIIYYFGQLFRRRVAFLNVLAASAFFILVINPYELFHIGFYLSFSAVFFITFLMIDLNRIQLVSDESDFFISKLERIKRVIRDYVWKSLKLTLAGVVGTLPIIWWKFGIITPGAFVANLFAIPLMFWTLGFSMLVFVLQFFLSIVNTILFQFGYDFFLTDFINSLSLYLTKTSCLGIEFLQWIENIVIKMPGCYFYVPNLSFLSTVLLYMSLLLLVFRRKFHIGTKGISIIFSVLVVFLGIEFFWSTNTNNRFIFTQLSGLRKSCSIIQTSDNKVILHDGGTLEYQVKARKLLNTLREKRINSIDVLIIQAQNLNAVDGYLYLLNQHRIYNVYLTEKLGETYNGEFLLKELRKLNVNYRFVSAGTEIKGFAKLNIQFISPPAKIQDELVVKFKPLFKLATVIEGEFGKIVIAGSSSDINYDADMKMIGKYAENVKILILPAKVNKTNTFDRWFKTINPKIVITASHNKISERDKTSIIENSQNFYDTKSTGATTYTYFYGSCKETVETFNLQKR